MLESLRGLGYTAATALADVIDNSIAAGASRVDLQFIWSQPRSAVLIIDDGSGMSESELDFAMRIGERSPLDGREASDLGRFGLGLKTASFSQCRRLTVASRKGGNTCCLRWDLDVLAASSGDGWYLLEGAASGSESLVEKYTPERGTLVVWETLDRLVPAGSTEQDLLDLIDRVDRHLGMVFHRYIEGPGKRLEIRINGRRVKPWDPFLSNHPATWPSPSERIAVPGGIVEVQCFVLPHRDRLRPAEYEEAGGPEGWTAQQGIYIYRNERLLVSGSWLGLGRGRAWTKEEAHRLARIRLDIPNTADSTWKLDIRKSMAQPPAVMKERLTRLCEDTRARARRVFAHRGQPERSNASTGVAQAWRAEQTSAGVRYRIDESHPAVRAVLDACDGNEAAVRAMLRVISETVPVQRIWLDTAEARETPRTGFAAVPATEVVSILAVLYRNLVVRRGATPEEARTQLLRTEPFNTYPELVRALPDRPDGEED